MTQEEGAQDESKSTAEPRRSSMNDSSSNVPTDRGSDSTSPSSSPPGGRRHTEETVGPAVLEMGSTDSAGNARSPSCGLVRSLLPSSCRGSAEAFARCLHRRLTSLGSEDGAAAGAAKPRETSWLRPSSSARHHSIGANHVLQSQPRHSPESDLFYDVELDDDEMMEDGAGSPADEATAAELARLLANCPDILKTGHHDGCHCSPSGSARTKTADHDSETSCVFVSPITGTSPDSDSSEVFFDPESSDADRLRPEQFFDPLGTSDSEVTSNASAPPRIHFDGPRRTDEKEEEASSESSCCSLPRRNSAIRENARICSSDENSELNGRSSQETTTSPSSLWSTFDESTVSLQDDDCSPSRISRDSVPSPIVPLPKSHSDSELQPSNGIVAAIDQLDAPHEVEEDSAVEWSDDRVIGNNDEYSPGHSDNLISKKREEEEGDGPSSRTDDGTSDENDSACDNTLDSPDALEPSSDTTANEASGDVNREYAKSTETKYREETTSWIDGGDSASNDEKKLRLLLKKLNDDSRQRASAQEKDTSPDECQEYQAGEAAEEEEDRPQRVRRCSSLKTGKTPPGTPRRKKIVRFADKLGLDLADVRTFLDEIPRVPNSAYNDLIYDDAAFRQQDSASVLSDWCEQRCPSYQENSALRRRSTSASSARKMDRMLVPLFQQPGGMANFLDMVRERRVCLENVLVQDPVTLAIQGTVRVINIDYHKSVHIRYTLNAWRNFSDLQATYVPNSCDGFSDKFSFVLYCHTLTVGQRLEFAVRFQCKGAQYWDNNTGANYCFQCLPASSPGYIPITADENHGWSPAFY